MILDKELIFAKEQELAAAGASTNIVDQNESGDAYDALWLVANVDSAITGTLGLDIETDSAANFSTAVALVSIAAVDARAAGNIIKMKLPRGTQRFIRVKWTGTVSDGKVSAFLVRDISL